MTFSNQRIGLRTKPVLPCEPQPPCFLRLPNCLSLGKVPRQSLAICLAGLGAGCGSGLSVLISNVGHGSPLTFHVLHNAGDWPNGFTSLNFLLIKRLVDLREASGYILNHILRTKSPPPSRKHGHSYLQRLHRFEQGGVQRGLDFLPSKKAA